MRTSNMPAQLAPEAQPTSHGLTSNEAKADLQKVGPNSVADVALPPLRRAIKKLWALALDARSGHRA